MQLQQFQGKTVLVTGGAGFIGSHLAQFLLEQTEAKVRVIDNLSTGFMHNIELFTSHPRYEFVFADVSKFEDCQRVVEGVDMILHQAALGSVPRSVTDPRTSHLSIDHGTFNLMVAAKEAGIKRFVYASSSSVYGDEAQLPKVEHKTGSALSPYAANKQVCEIYGQVFHRCYGMETVGLRYFNVFGPRQNPNGAYAAVIPKFVSLLRQGKRPTINGDGSYSRDFTYIDNVVQGNIKALLMSSEDPSTFGTAYNIGAGGRFTVEQLYRGIQTLMNSNIEPIYGVNRPGDIPHSNASIQKAEKTLNYHPTVAFEEGLERTVNWFLNQ